MQLHHPILSILNPRAKQNLRIRKPDALKSPPSRKLAVFKGVDEDSLKIIARSARYTEWQAHRNVISQGQDDALHVLADGYMNLVHASVTGRNLYLLYSRHQELVGIHQFMTGQQHICDGRTLTPCSLLTIKKTALKEVFPRSVELRQNMTAEYNAIWPRQMCLHEALVQTEVLDRLVLGLYVLVKEQGDLSDDSGTHDDSSSRILHRRVTVAELAGLIDACYRRTYGAIQTLRDEKIIKCEVGRLTVPSMNNLYNLLFRSQELLVT